MITCEYDGLSRRIVKVDKTGMADVTYDYYHDGNQIIETRKDADTDPLEQFVWHTYYIDALAVRRVRKGSTKRGRGSFLTSRPDRESGPQRLGPVWTAKGRVLDPRRRGQRHRSVQVLL